MREIVVATPFIRNRGKRQTVSCEVVFSGRKDRQLRPIYVRRQNGGIHGRIWGLEGQHSRRSVFGGPRANVSSRVSRLSGMCCDFMLVTRNIALFYSLRILHSNGWGCRAFPGCKHLCRLQAKTADDDRNVGSQRGHEKVQCKRVYGNVESLLAVAVKKRGNGKFRLQ